MLNTLKRCALLCLSLTSCEYDYSDYMNEFTPQIVVNSFICPDEDIKVAMFWTKEYNDNAPYRGVRGFDAKIYENGVLIYEGVDLSDSIVANYHPKEGAVYRLEADIANYGEVSAETYIPYKPIVDIKLTETKGMNSNSNVRYLHFEIEELKLPEKLRSVMIRSTMHYVHTIPPETWGELYLNNSFCDPFNSAYSHRLNEYIGTDRYYCYYVRIPYINIANITPFAFVGPATVSRYFESDTIIGYDSYGDPIYESVEVDAKYLEIEIMSPSDEYDKYLKAVYLQKYHQDSDIGIFNLAYPIPFNIENGLGVFAGYSSMKFKQGIEK
jgi:hypothetical protein